MRKGEGKGGEDRRAEERRSEEREKQHSRSLSPCLAACTGHLPLARFQRLPGRRGSLPALPPMSPPHTPPSARTCRTHTQHSLGHAGTVSLTHTHLDCIHVFGDTHTLTVHAHTVYAMANGMAHKRK